MYPEYWNALVAFSPWYLPPLLFQHGTKITSDLGVLYTQLYNNVQLVHVLLDLCAADTVSWFEKDNYHFVSGVFKPTLFYFRVEFIVVYHQMFISSKKNQT